MELAEMTNKLEELSQKLADMRDILHIDKKKVWITELSKHMQDPNFWSDQERATKVSKELNDLQAEVELFERLTKGIKDLSEMEAMAEGDASLQQDIEKQCEEYTKDIEKLEFNTLLNGKHDARNAIVNIHAGSGGTEAQDWAEMLMRMYLRYAENHEWKVTLLDESKGQEAGIKSATFRVEGCYTYGYMKSEHGTHRLVRISPFDAEGMRHTSFARVEVIPEMEESDDFVIDEKELRIDIFMSGGKGGQSVNTTYSAVRIVHEPTGITVQCQNERSQLQNKETAMRVLRSKLQKVQEEKEEEERLKLRGEYKSPEWGNQIRNYVLHPYHLVKDVRTQHETADDTRVLNGDIDDFVEAYLRWEKTR